MKEIMIEEFTLGTRKQKEWGWSIAIALFFAAVGSGLFLISLLFQAFTGLDLSLGLLIGVIVGGAATGLTFIIDLGNKAQFLRVFKRPLSSWLSRGSLLILIFLISGILYVAPAYLSFLPWDNGSGFGITMGVIGGIAALGLMMYSGFLLASSPSIAFWNTPLLPILFVFYGLMSGVAVTLALNAGSSGIEILSLIEVGLIILSLIIIGAYLLAMYYSVESAKEAVISLIKGNLMAIFIWGVLIVGLVVPLILALIAYFGGGIVPGLMVVAFLCEITGGLLFRYSLLRAGVYASNI